MTFESILFFTVVYGYMLGMIVFAVAMEPRKSNSNSGVRL